MHSRLCPAKLADRVAVARLLDVVTPDLVEEAISRSNAREQRSRQMPSWLSLYFCLAAWLWAGDGYANVYGKLADGLVWCGRNVPGDPPNVPSISRALDRLGPEPLSALFQRLAAADTGQSLTLDITHVGVSRPCDFPRARIAVLTGDRGVVDATWAPASVAEDDLPGRLAYLRGRPGAVTAESSGELLRWVTGDAGARAMLRSRTVSGVDQEIWALLCVRQAFG
jgi:hypothetical protein